MLNDCSKPSLWDLRDAGLKLKWTLGSYLKTKLSKNRNSCLGHRAGGLPALIRICTGPSMGGRKCMVTGMWRSQICVHKCEVTHAHTRAWALSGNSRAGGAKWAPARQSAGAPGTRTRDWQGWVIFSFSLGWKLLTSFAFCTRSFAGELSCHRALRAVGPTGERTRCFRRTLASRDPGRVTLQRAGCPASRSQESSRSFLKAACNRERACNCGHMVWIPFVRISSLTLDIFICRMT